MNKDICVTSPYLPPLAELLPYLQQIWDNRIVTNDGPLRRQFEAALCDFLEVPHITPLASGTQGLLTAVQALGLSGEVITTPYSFVATSHALFWNRITPVFVDVDPRTLNLDPQGIEAAITPRTTGILAVHCYGNPCDVDAIRGIAERHKLRVIYDAAHAFGVQDAGGSITRHGDLSVLSFHATKVFNTFEGGAVICADARLKTRIEQLKNFGFVDETTVEEPGLNGKMSEFNAALGLLQLRYVEQAIGERRVIDTSYRELLQDVPGIRCLASPRGGQPNHTYFPIFVGPEYPLSRDELYERLKQHQICPRRYFYPLISEFSLYRSLPSATPANLPVATTASRQALCLPIYPGLEPTVIAKVAEIITSA